MPKYIIDMIEKRTIVQKLKNNEARPKFAGSYKKKRVVHGQISLCSSRIVETLATNRKLDTTITHLQYLDLNRDMVF